MIKRRSQPRTSRASHSVSTVRSGARAGSVKQRTVTAVRPLAAAVLALSAALLHAPAALAATTVTIGTINNPDMVELKKQIGRAHV